MISPFRDAGLMAAAAVSNRRRSRRDIGNSEDGGERVDAPACGVCLVIASAQQQGRASATHLTHAIARTSRMTLAPAT